MKTDLFAPFGIPLSGILLALFALTAGCTAAPTKATPPLVATPVKTDSATLQANLLQLDAFLDQNTNTTLEADLRQDIRLAEDAEFLKKYPTWKQLRDERPALVLALRSEDHFLLHRALARMTGNLPLEARHLQRLDSFLESHPTIQAGLEADPSRLIDGDFLVKNPPLAAFFYRHPDLYTVFFDNAAKQSALPKPAAD